MITDWNSPQGDFDPTEKQGELLMLLSGQQVTVHTSAEDDFDYMENEDVAFVVKNPHSEEDLLIELCGEFSVFFEKWHGEYPATEEGYAQMTRDVQAVLAGSAGALSLYTEDGRNKERPRTLRSTGTFCITGRGLIAGTGPPSAAW